MLQPLFVYGTLKRGFPLHSVLQGQVYCGEVWTEACGRLFDCGDWPALVEHPDAISIHGELYQVTEPCLRRCDVVEDVKNGLYERRRIRLKPAAAKTPGVERAWCYFFLHPTDGMPDCGGRWPA